MLDFPEANRFFELFVISFDLSLNHRANDPHSMEVSFATIAQVGTEHCALRGVERYDN